MGENYHNLKTLARQLTHTVCESRTARISASAGTTHRYFHAAERICVPALRRAVPKGRPEPIDFDEPHAWQKR